MEGINNKIKVTKHNAYGFRDEKLTLGYMPYMIAVSLEMSDEPYMFLHGCPLKRDTDYATRIMQLA